MTPIAKTYAWILLLVFLVGCASLGLPTATTPNEKLAVAYGTVVEMRTTTTRLLIDKKITPDDAQNVMDQTDNARAGLDIARNINRTDPAAADAKITSVKTVLKALSSYLSSKGAKP